MSLAARVAVRPETAEPFSTGAAGAAFGALPVLGGASPSPGAARRVERLHAALVACLPALARHARDVRLGRRRTAAEAVRARVLRGELGGRRPRGPGPPRGIRRRILARPTSPSALRLLAALLPLRRGRGADLAGGLPPLSRRLFSAPRSVFSGFAGGGSLRGSPFSRAARVGEGLAVLRALGLGTLPRGAGNRPSRRPPRVAPRLWPPPCARLCRRARSPCRVSRRPSRRVPRRLPSAVFPSPWVSLAACLFVRPAALCARSRYASTAFFERSEDGRCP